MLNLDRESGLGNGQEALMLASPSLEHSGEVKVRLKLTAVSLVPGSDSTWDLN
jgi:hypothetical protein